MSSDRERLLSAFFNRRDAILRFLARRTGSADLAEDLCQDAWMRIAHGGQAEAITNPNAYVFRVAANLAADFRRREQSRKLTRQEIDAALSLPDEAPGPEATLLARSEMAALSSALAELPRRCREIFLLSRIERRPHRDIAQRYSISTRTVENEIVRALEHCALRLERIR